MKMRYTATVLVLALIAGPAAGFAQGGGEATYKAKCQICHGATGMADTPTAKMMKVKPFNDPILIKMSDTAILRLTQNGAGKMPAFKDKISESELNDVVAYIHELQKKK